MNTVAELLVLLDRTMAGLFLRRGIAGRYAYIQHLDVERMEGQDVCSNTRAEEKQAGKP